MFRKTNAFIGQANVRYRRMQDYTILTAQQKYLLQITQNHTSKQETLTK